MNKLIKNIHTKNGSKITTWTAVSANWQNQDYIFKNI